MKKKIIEYSNCPFRIFKIINVEICQRLAEVRKFEQKKPFVCACGIERTLNDTTYDWQQTTTTTAY